MRGEGDVLLADGEFRAPHTNYQNANGDFLSSWSSLALPTQVDGKYKGSAAVLSPSDDYSPSIMPRIEAIRSKNGPILDSSADLELPALSDLEASEEPVSSPRFAASRNSPMPQNLLPTTPSMNKPGPWHSRAAESSTPDVVQSPDSLSVDADEPSSVVRRVRSTSDVGPGDPVSPGAEDVPLEPPQERAMRVLRKFPSMPSPHADEIMGHIDVAGFSSQRSPKPPPQRIITVSPEDEPVPISRRSSLEALSPSSVIISNGFSPASSSAPGTPSVGLAGMLSVSPRVRADSYNALARNRPRAWEGRVTVEALVDAVRAQDLKSIRSLLQDCPSPREALQEIHPVSKLTALHEAVLMEDEATVLQLLNAGADPNGAPCPKGPPLIAAVQKGNEKLMKMLLTSGANINATDEENFNTALHHACILGNRSVVKVLLFTGASTSAINKEGKTPLQLATDESIVRLLETKHRDSSGLFSSEAMGRLSPYCSPPISPSGVMETRDVSRTSSPRTSHRGWSDGDDGVENSSLRHADMYGSFSSSSTVDTMLEDAEESFLHSAVEMLKAEGLPEEELLEYTEDPQLRPHLAKNHHYSHHNVASVDHSRTWNTHLHRDNDDDDGVLDHRLLSPRRTISEQSELSLKNLGVSGMHDLDYGDTVERDDSQEDFDWHEVAPRDFQDSGSSGEDGGRRSKSEWSGFSRFNEVRSDSDYGTRGGAPGNEPEYDGGPSLMQPSPPREPNHDGLRLGSSSPNVRPGNFSPRAGSGEGWAHIQSGGPRPSKQLFGEAWLGSPGPLPERPPELGLMDRTGSMGGAGNQGSSPRPFTRTRSTSVSAIDLASQESYLHPERPPFVRQPSMESLVLRDEDPSDNRIMLERPSPGRTMSDRGSRGAAGLASGADRWGMPATTLGLLKPTRPNGASSGPSRGQERHTMSTLWRDDGEVERERPGRLAGMSRSASTSAAVPRHDGEFDLESPPAISKRDSLGREKPQSSSPRLRLRPVDVRQDRQNWSMRAGPGGSDKGGPGLGGLVPSKPAERGSLNASPRLIGKSSRMTEQGSPYQQRSIIPPPPPNPLELEHPPPSRPRTPPPAGPPPLTSAIRRGSVPIPRSESGKEKRKVKFVLPDSPGENAAASKEDVEGIRADWRSAAAAGACVACGKEGCNKVCIEKQGQTKTGQDVPQNLFSNAERKSTGRLKWTRGELLGEGAYGKVFAGLNQSTGELMAVKQLKLAEGDDKSQHMAALEREIALYRKMRHKHIVGYIDMEKDEASGSLYVFLEFVSGGSIHSMLERFGKFSEPLVQIYTRQLLLGLEYLHAQKIIHRDIKGGNVLVDADGVIKLADFGASKAFHDATLTDGCKSIRGSVFWMAPEVIKGEGYGRRADIWSVGCTVIEMLTGTHPWPGMDNTWTAIFHIAKTTTGPPMPADCSDLTKDFLSQCFQLSPADRPSASHLLNHPFVAVQDTPKESR